MSVFAFIIDGGNCTFLFEGMDRFKAIGCSSMLVDGKIIVDFPDFRLEISRIDDYHYKIIRRMYNGKYEEYELATDIEPITLVEENGGSTGIIEWDFPSGKAYKVIIY